MGLIMNVTVPVLTQPPPTISNSIPLSKWEIKGECLTIKKTIPLQMWQDLPHEVIKRDMVKLIVEELLRNNYIEFTFQVEPNTPDMADIKARIFVTPDSQVRILRVNGVI